MADLIYTYPTLYPGKLLKRYKRFFADVELDSGEVVTAHCPNTGPMTGVCHLGNRVMLSKSDSPTRKLAYTWEMIEIHEPGPDLTDPQRSAPPPVWVGVNTSLPNKIIRSVLEQNLLQKYLGEYTEIRHEVPYGEDRKSRIDFLVNGGPKPIYIEVKNTTWTDGTLALFPDTETTRGQKHLRELTALVPEARSVMLYLINRSDCDRFAPGDSRDPKYGKLLRSAVAQGVEILPCRFEVTPAGVHYLGLATLLQPLQQPELNADGP
jgi:sugar fermentation stimulation protein A